MKYRLDIAYDGTNYSGWQVQKNALSIQSLIEKALGISLRKNTSIVGSGRTDAGVHARGQVAHFESSAPIDLYRLRASLLALLPPDIRILEIQTATDDFHARYSAKKKIYHYHLHLQPVMDPHKRLYALHIPYPIDLSALTTAAELFLGEHDFTSFANEADRGCAKNKPIKTLYRLDLMQEEGGLVLQFVADGFLYKMVRNIVGTLLNVACGKIAPEAIVAILAAKDRRKAAAAAPAHGLFLHQVLY